MCPTFSFKNFVFKATFLDDTDGRRRAEKCKVRSNLRKCSVTFKKHFHCLLEDINAKQALIGEGANSGWNLWPDWIRNISLGKWNDRHNLFNCSFDRNLKYCGISWSEKEPIVRHILYSFGSGALSKIGGEIILKYFSQ